MRAPARRSTRAGSVTSMIRSGPGIGRRPARRGGGIPTPKRGSFGGEIRDLVSAAVEALPPRQKEVVVLRDVQGLDSEEVCELLRMTAGNQRVLLHRGRAKVRAALEVYYSRE